MPAADVEQNRAYHLRLAAALAAQREAVERHDFHGEPVAAVATALGRTPAAAAALMMRGLKALRDTLREHGG
jgi:DNA-directed RNA polymerase specialized sigma24 family protein